MIDKPFQLGKLDPMTEYRIQFALKGKREHIAKANTTNIAYPTQHIDIEIPQGSRGDVIVRWWFRKHCYFFKIKIVLKLPLALRFNQQINNVVL